MGFATRFGVSLALTHIPSPGEPGEGRAEGLDGSLARLGRWGGLCCPGGGPGGGDPSLFGALGLAEVVGSD